jgi:hypothetical protein
MYTTVRDATHPLPPWNSACLPILVFFLSTVNFGLFCCYVSAFITSSSSVPNLLSTLSHEILIQNLVSFISGSILFYYDYYYIIPSIVSPSFSSSFSLASSLWRCDPSGIAICSPCCSSSFRHYRPIVPEVQSFPHCAMFPAAYVEATFQPCGSLMASHKSLSIKFCKLKWRTGIWSPYVRGWVSAGGRG